MIIGLTGLKGSGKDTAGAYLVKEHDFQRRAFADPGKKMIANALGIPQWEIENFKNDDTVFVTTGYKNKNPELQPYLDLKVSIPEELYHAPDNIWSPICEQTFRQFTQSFLNEAAKSVFGEDVWTNLTLPVGGYYSGKAIVITDVRFIVEANRIWELGGYIIRIENTSLVVEDPHRSEVEQLDIIPNYIVMNNSTIEELYKQVEITLEAIGESTN